MRKTATGLLLTLAVPALSALPVISLPAASARPVPPVAWSVPASGVADPALRSPAGRASLRVSVAARAAVPASERGVLPARPAVLTSPRRTEKFALLGATWRSGTSARLTVLVRTHGGDGWSRWRSLDRADTPDPIEGAHVRGGTEPLWTGSADGYQLRVDVRAGRLPADLRVDLVDPGSSPADGTLGQRRPLATAAALAWRPQIYGRRVWGADESLRNGGPRYTSTIRAAFVHHTATANGYSASDVPKIIRAIYAYHVKSSGWSDIGYNFLVDRFGRVWEGRYGGVARRVLGAHTGGFNTSSVGVAAVGNFGSAAVTARMKRRIGNLIAWKLDIDHRNPQGRATLTSSGAGTSRYPKGREVTFSVISGHRDAGFTDCPGVYLYGRLPNIRARADARMGAAVINPTVSGGGPLIVRARGWLLKHDHRWRVTLRDQASRNVGRKTGVGRFDTTLRAPRTGTYRVVIESWGDGRTARPYEQVIKR